MGNGQICWQGNTGSIHMIGKSIQKKSCNGWEHWYYENGEGELVVIDQLREQARREMGIL